MCYTAHKIIKPALCTYLCHKICYLLTITFYLSWGQIPNIQIQLRKIVQNKNEINTCFPLCSSDPSKNRQPAVSVDIFLPVIYIRFNQNPKLQLARHLCECLQSVPVKPPAGLNLETGSLTTAIHTYRYSVYCGLIFDSFGLFRSPSLIYYYFDLFGKQAK